MRVVPFLLAGVGPARRVGRSPEPWVCAAEELIDDWLVQWVP